jgi:hypothetical protein
MKRNHLILWVGLCLASTLFGQSKVGTTAAPFLGISVGPRATAMGGAFAGVADDATTLYYNPGGISRAGRMQFALAHTNWLLGTRFNWLGFILNLDGANAIGIGFTQLDYGEEEVTTVTDPEGTGETWGASDMALTLSYARNLTDRFSIGGSAKYVQMKIWNESASALALDVGLLFTTDFNGMKLGMSISNFGNDMRLDGRDLLKRIDLDPDVQGNNETIVSKLKTDSWPLPLFFRVGVAMDVVKVQNHRLTVALDALRPSDNVETLNVGSELSLGEMLFLRGGYKSLLNDDSEEGLTAGLGLRLGWSGQMSWCLDYTFTDFGILENVHMIAVGFRY